MIFLKSPAEAKAWCEAQRQAGNRLGYVPTMGALHNGHLALVARAVEENHAALVSIFINPLQFNNPADLDTYPRDMDADLALLESAGVAMVYTGTLEGFFPGIEHPGDIRIEAPCAAISGLEAESRPGHLEGVQAIVEQLFATAGDCRAYFGEKDFQQTLVVRELAGRHGGVDVIVCPTVREPGGLAMSSRNQRLSAQGKETARALFRALCAADDAWQAGVRNPTRLEAVMAGELRHPQISVEYTAVRDRNRWTADTPASVDAPQALVAAVIEDVRLIDNLQLGGNSSEPMTIPDAAD